MSGNKIGYKFGNKQYYAYAYRNNLYSYVLLMSRCQYK